MDYGVWTMDYGLWSMDYGLLSMWGKEKGKVQYKNNLKNVSMYIYFKNIIYHHHHHHHNQ